jgi:diguanylate cyclase (GGDEF)-like protein/PAS domain S-box-containing protein/putative nucleotidyltransferase with HDIG domain
MKKIIVTLILMFVFLFTPSLDVSAHTNDIDFYKIFDNHGSIMLIIDMGNDNIIYANKAASDFYGYKKEQLESMNINQLNTLTPEETEKEMQDALNQKRNYFIFEHKIANGDIKTVEVQSYPYIHGDKALLVSIINDVTMRNQLEQSNKMMTSAFFMMLTIAVIVLSTTTFLLFRNFRKLKTKNDEINYLSYYDPLTGLYNRRFFEEELNRLDTEDNLPISIIMGDVDDLKLANDIFGHSAGDMLITKVAEVMKSGCRKEDIIARWAGDEFIIILPNTKNEEAEEIAKRIKSRLSKEHIKAIKVSISLGCDTKNSVEESISQVIENAENKMYSQKTLDRKSIHINTIYTIIKTLHEKSHKEKEHSKHVSRICQDIGRAMNLSEDEIKSLKDAGYLHDIGKIVTDDQQHPVAGYRILNYFDETVELAKYVLSHHERWDGSGYPKGLKGEDIPVVSRIIAIAESYEELINSSMSKDDAILEIEKDSGSKFDPYIVEVFIKMLKNN